MREIEFRGKVIDENGKIGKWIYGDLISSYGSWRNAIRVNPVYIAPINIDTIGQYTGLKDKNGKKIFEGDILKANNNRYLYKVYFDENKFIIEDKWGNTIKPIQRAIDHFECEIVGNVFENSDLLGEDDEVK